MVLDIRSAIDGGGVEAYAQGAHPRRRAQRLRQGRLARDAQRRAVHAADARRELEKLIGETGIDEDSHVVVVPAGVSATDFGSAARVYWTLKVAGHPAVSILDGGFAAWQAASYPVESGKNPPSPKIFTAKIDNVAVGRGRRGGEREFGGATLLDARPASFFDGRQKAPAPKAYGHIPGAINLDSAAFYDPATNRLRSKDELAGDRAQRCRPVRSSPIATPATGRRPTGSCCRRCSGRPDVRLYDGSMVEWTADARRPVASSRTRWDDVKKALGFGS